MRRRGVWLAALALLALLLAALLLAGSAIVLRQLPGLQGLQGSLWTGLSAERLGGESGGLRWQADGLQLAPLRWRNGQLVSALQLRRLQITLPPGDGSPPPSAEQLLARLRLPLSVRLAPLRIERLQLDAQQIEQLQINTVELGGHELRARFAELSLVETRSRLRLAGDARLQGDGLLRLNLSAERDALRLLAEGEGRLDALPLSVRLLQAQQQRLRAELQLAPLAAEPLQILRALDARFDDLDPRTFHERAPQGAWSGRLQLGPGPAQPWQLRLDASNAAAARLDLGGWPLRRLQVALQLDPARWQALLLEQLDLELGSAAGRAAGQLALLPQQGLPQAGRALDSRLQLRELSLRELDARWPAGRLSGELGLRQARLDLDAPLDWRLRLQAALPQPLADWRAEGEGQLQGRRLRIDSLQLRQGQALAELRAEAELLVDGWRSEGKLQLGGLSLPLPPWPQSSLLRAKADWQLREDGQGRQLGQLRLQLLDGNRLAGLPLQGEFDWQGLAAAQQWSLSLQGEQGLQLRASAAPNQPLRARRQPPRASDWLPQQADWELPQLAALRPLWQPWLQQLSGSAVGRWQQAAPGAWPALTLQLQGLQLQTSSQSPPLRLQSLQANLRGDDGELQLQGLARGDWLLGSLRAQGGREQAWQLDGAAEHRVASGTRRWRLSAASAAAEFDDSQWRWPGLRVELARAEESTPLLLLRDALLERKGEALRLKGGSLQLGGQTLALHQASWARNGHWALALDGRPQLAAWLRQLDPGKPWAGDAAADLRLQARGEPGLRPQLDLQLDGLQGDLRLERQALNLQTLQLSLQQQADGDGQLRLALRSRLLGELEASLKQSAAGGLAGQLRAELPQLASLRPWLPGGLQLDGHASLEALVGGSLQQPQLRGQLLLQLQRLLHPGSGLATQQGELRAEFSQDRLLLQRLQLQGQAGPQDDGGLLSGSGELRWGGDSLQAELQLQAERFRALNRFDRRLVASGDARLSLQPRRWRLSAQLRADEGVYEIGSPDAPALDDDVQVVELSDTPRDATPSRWQRELDLRVDLGQRLRVQGRGFASRLTGQLRLQDQGQGLRATGLIETQGGRYKAYGQTLDLESGEIRFNGSLDNPRLDLLAIKPDIEHRVGVSVTGSAQSPRVRLYAEPELPDNDKLAWLLLGRDPAEVEGRDTAILQRAALALLSGEGGGPASDLMDKLGLTEFSISQGDDATTVLRLGAQLSRRWSVGYERSLNAATGSWQLVYRLGQRFRLRAQSGLDSAVDLLWLWRFD